MRDNIFFLCLDSVRYDTFAVAHAPNMKKVGTLRRVYSQGCWTVPSIVGYLMNMPPIGKSGRLFNEVPKLRWIPKHLRELGYTTVWISGNASVDQFDIGVQGSFRNGFSVFRSSEDLVHVEAVVDELESVVHGIKEISRKHPIFIMCLLLDTHRPYYFGSEEEDLDPKYPDRNFRNQVRAVENIDVHFPSMLEPILKKTKHFTRVFITSDHGELFGPDYWSHDPCNNLEFDRKLFEIPFIEGRV